MKIAVEEVLRYTDGILIKKWAPSDPKVNTIPKLIEVGELDQTTILRGDNNGR